MERKTYAIDIDGTLHDEIWWEGKGDMPDPVAERIEKVNRLYEEGNVVFMHTGRKESARHQTELWLKKHKVKYHALVMGNLAVDVYVMDNCINHKQFFNE